jgi:hypothetical protein
MSNHEYKLADLSLVAFHLGVSLDEVKKWQEEGCDALIHPPPYNPIEIAKWRLSKQNKFEGELDILAAEYDKMWSYYNKSLDIRKDFIDWYFKAIAVPAGIIAYLLRNVDKIQIQSSIPIAVTLTLWIMGIAIFATYTLESRNASNYEKACKSIRSEWRKKSPILKEAIIIDDLRTTFGRSPTLQLDSIKFWRGTIIAVPNSFIALLLGISIFSFCADSYQTFAGFSFAAISVLLHFGLWCFIDKSRNSSSEKNLIYFDRFTPIFFRYYPIICFAVLLIILPVILIRAPLKTEVDRTGYPGDIRYNNREQ